MRQDQPHPVCPVACCVRSELEDVLRNAERAMLQHLAVIPVSQLTEQAVEEKVIVELKSVEHVHPAHKKQVLTCLRLTGMHPGSLLNFSEALMKNGITRMVRGEL